MTYPDDSNVTYEYDTLGRVTKIKYNDSNVAEYEYDELSRRKLLTLGNDANAVYEYNINNWLISLVNHINDVNVSFEYDKYDKVGNRKSCVIDNNSAAAYVFDYDEIYRLVFADYNDGNFVDYTYDALGNRDEVV